MDFISGLARAECGACQGQGYTDGDHTEPAYRCETCGGAGYAEVCGRCGDLPSVENGLEVCGCTPAALGVAA